MWDRSLPLGTPTASLDTGPLCRWPLRPGSWQRSSSGPRASGPQQPLTLAWPLGVARLQDREGVGWPGVPASAPQHLSQGHQETTHDLGSETLCPQPHATKIYPATDTTPLHTARKRLEPPTHTHDLHESYVLLWPHLSWRFPSPPPSSVSSRSSPEKLQRDAAIGGSSGATLHLPRYPILAHPSGPLPSQTRRLSQARAMAVTAGSVCTWPGRGGPPGDVVTT